VDLSDPRPSGSSLRAKLTPCRARRR
jgi:hypothetical protein